MKEIEVKNKITLKDIATAMGKLVGDKKLKDANDRFESYWLYFAELFPSECYDDVIYNESLMEVAKAFYMAGAVEGNEESFAQMFERLKENYPLACHDMPKDAQ